MNAYNLLSSALEWNDCSIEWIFNSYKDYLLKRLAQYCDGNGENAVELNLLCKQLSQDELASFVTYPYVAAILLPRTRYFSDEDEWPILAYALSYLAWLGKAPLSHILMPLPTEALRLPVSSIPAIRRADFDLPISFHDQLTFPGMDRGGNDLYILSNSVATDELKRIVQAQDLIKKWIYPAWKFTAIGTELLAIRGESSEPDKFGSASFRGLAGLNLIINPQKVSLSLIIEAIVHESIHSLLYQLEPSFGDFFPDKTNSRNPVVSPWTGSTITLDNIAQASFVWYGLLNFWSLSLEAAKEDKLASDVESNIQKISKGFKNLNVEIFEKDLNKDMFEAIRYMQTNVKTKYS